MNNLQLLTSGAISLIFLLVTRSDLEKYNTEDFITKIAHFIIYLTVINSTSDIASAFYKFLQTRNYEAFLKVLKAYKTHSITFGVAVAVLITTKKPLFEVEVVLLAMASLVTKYPEMSKLTSVSYGVGMACSFFEGYLGIVIPGDGGHNMGLVRNIEAYEAQKNISIPVKRLFLVIPRSLHCPPRLSDFNKENAEERGITFLEACLHLQDVVRDMAGVTARVYRNSVYKVRSGAARVHVVAEFATPLSTMHKVMCRRAVFEELQKADFDEIRIEFCSMLMKIMDTIPECRRRCELIHYDDTDPSQNLGDLILERIHKLEPNYNELLNLRQLGPQ